MSNTNKFPKFPKIEGLGEYDDFSEYDKPNSSQSKWLQHASFPDTKILPEKLSQARLPQIRSPRILRALNMSEKIYHTLTKNLHRHLPASLDQELRHLVLEDLQHTHRALEGVRVIDLQLKLRLAFGKPTLISADLLVEVRPADIRQIGQIPADRQQTQTPQQFFLVDLFSQLVEKLWDNPLLAPVAIRARLMQATGSTEIPSIDSNPRSTENHQHFAEPTILADMRVLGYPDEIARPEDLYANFGSPAADPKWRP